MSSYDEAILAAKALSSKKGLDIQIIKIADVSVLADYMVIATGTSSTHVKALADEVEYKQCEQSAPNKLFPNGFFFAS